ncbi:phage holin family protein [Phnomibacter ginsenosidimutans]|uniref:Phage holin family protein n=1 Tax=Phnomibacter ginsenosidimutans TaxID=2676868 RepID=A0A6I6GEV8_9BACT|nr:phage holin family protein [Phnomibacter ginsenosidimutans]QGW28940.1 hypothetical protein GLV81_13270 [Phnomibacter ginsenosidimutans]
MPNRQEEGLYDEVQQTVKQLVNDRLLLAKMEATEKLSIISGKVIIAVLAGVLLFFALLFISLMAGYFFSQVFESFFAGFGLVAAFYVLLLLILLAFLKAPLQRSIENGIISTLFASDDNND